jgi:hypothetical protein
MSIEALSIVLNHSKARGAAKVILIGIANHLGPDAHEGAWPSQARLAGYANISDRAVRDAIDNLISLGELRVEQAAGPSRNQYKPNRYWINLRCPESCDGTLGHNSKPDNSRVEETDSQGGSFQQSGWKQTSDKPSRETEKKQITAMFEEFWKEYPKAPQHRTERRQDALREFKSALTRASFEDILAGTIAYRNDPKENRYKLIAVKWLRNDGWETATTQPQQTESYFTSERREKEREATQQFLAEQREAEVGATIKLCQHGLTIARCLPCAKEINA